MFDQRRIVSAAGGPGVQVYDKADGNQWECGATISTESTNGESAHVKVHVPANDVVQRLRIKDGYMIDARRSGIVSVWSC